MDCLIDYSKLLEQRDDFELFGKQGFCIIEDHFIKKIYYEPRKLKYDFSQYESERIAFPISYLYDRESVISDIVVGEIMYYLPGSMISWYTCQNIKFTEFIVFYRQIIEEIRKYPEILMVDLGYPNILYDSESGFYLIDTTRWIITCEQRRNVNRNLRMFNSGINDKFFFGCALTSSRLFGNDSFLEKLRYYGKRGRELYNLIIKSINSGEWLIVEILEIYLDMFNNQEFGPINTFEDVKNHIKMLKKG